jgi:hypothetical protein
VHKEGVIYRRADDVEDRAFVLLGSLASVHPTINVEPFSVMLKLSQTDRFL